MDLDDPTEYEFANKYLDGWEHWNMLCQCNWFRPYVERWRQELELREMAKLIKRVRLQAAQGGRDSLMAAKYLMERGWLPKDVKTKKAVAKEKVLEEVERQEKESINEHAERLGISIVKG